MPLAADSIPKPRRGDLLIKEMATGEHVVKDPRAGTYFNFPAQESFLLLQLDGKQTVNDICQQFEQRFGEPISPDDVDQFVGLVQTQGFLETEETRDVVTVPAAPSTFKIPTSPLELAKTVLFWRFSAFDPDRFFNWLEPKIAWMWSAAFFWSTLTLIGVASFILWTSWHEYTDYLPEILSWETILIAWVVLCIVTTGHEFAHGLTCKHYGGEVHELGFMLMFFMPCFYCNVSDAWLIREKSRRLWVTLAGSYFDLCLWAIATIVWRLTLPYSVPYHMAWVVMSICGGRVFLNINPLFKLDGYYLLSDLLEIPNLRERSIDHFMAHVRWILWGAPRPEAKPRGTLLFWFGAAAWGFTIFYLSLMLIGMHHYLLRSLGLFGILLLAGLAWIVLPGLTSGLFEGEVKKMLRERWTRTALWIAIPAAVLVLSFIIRMDDWVSGTFKSRATVRAEVRAPVNGFLRIAYADEGHRVSQGAPVVLLEIPDLESKLAQRKAEETEITARLRALEIGARPEELAELRDKVKRAKTWRDRAKLELERKQDAFKEELNRVDEQILQAQTQLDFNKGVLERSKRLVEKKALPQDHVYEAEKQVLLAQAHLAQTKAGKRERQLLGNLDAEGELAKRDKEYADAASALKLLEAGTRVEELEAERAKLARVKEDRAFLERQREKLKVTSPVPGLVITPHLMEKVGQYFKEGDLICEIEEPASMAIEIPLEEQDIARVTTGLQVDLKPRSQPFHTISAKVCHIASQATVGKVQSTVNVCCTPDESSDELRANMTGYARIYTDRTSLASYVGHRVWRYFRTEIWW